MKKLGMLLGLMIATSAYALPGERILTCQGAGNLTLTLVQSPNPAIAVASLDLNQAGKCELTCRRAIPQAGRPSSIFECGENVVYRAPYRISITQGGYAGIPTAKVAKEGVRLFTLVCNY